MKNGTGMIRSESSLKRVRCVSTVNKSHGYSRRGFLQNVGWVTLISLVPGTSLGTPGNSPDYLSVEYLPQPTAQVLLRMLRLLFPHDAIDDGPYIAVVGTFDQMVAAKPDLFALLNAGVQELNDAQAEPWLKLKQTKQLELLKLIEVKPFFQTVRVTGRFLFYDNKEVWPYFGYEGSSYEHGGYLHRGFNDLDWLPEPEG